MSHRTGIATAASSRSNMAAVLLLPPPPRWQPHRSCCGVSAPARRSSGHCSGSRARPRRRFDSAPAQGVSGRGPSQQQPPGRASPDWTVTTGERCCRRRAWGRRLVAGHLIGGEACATTTRRGPERPGPRQALRDDSRAARVALQGAGTRSRRPADGPLATVMMARTDAVLPISVPPAGTPPDEDQRWKSSRMTKRGGTVALSYMMCAVSLVMFNKAALSSYRFPCANVITVLQMGCSTAVLFVLRRLEVISFADDRILAGKGFVPMRIVKQASPLAIAYLFYMVVGMASIRGVNVPMYTTLRRTTVIFTMVLEFFLVGQRHSTPIVSSVGLIVLGAFIAGARDLSFDSNGYLVVLISNVTTAMYLTIISRLGKATGLNTFGLMWCNGIVCGPILLLWTILSGELGLALQFPAVVLPSFQLIMILSCMMAFCLNYTIFLNTSLNSPLTQTMCGNIKDFGTVLIGWLWFGGLPFDWLNVLGQFLGFLGSGLYAYCKLKGV